MLNLPLVSFIVSSYNYENYIGQTLESIKNQTYKNIEIIIVDDFSTDNSVKNIQEFIKNNPNSNIKLLKHKSNKGQFSAIKTGLKEANGQFVSFIDSDDLLHPNYAEIFIKYHLSSSVAFISCEIAEIDENNILHTFNSNGDFSQEKIVNIEDIIKNQKENLELKILEKNHFGGWYWSPMSANMFRKTSVDFILQYEDESEWRICPDKFILNFADLIGKSALLNFPLLAYRRHSKNAGNSNKICGYKKYNCDNTTIINIKNNKKIRKCALKFLNTKNEYFKDKFGTRGLREFRQKIILSYFRIDFKKVIRCMFKL